MSTRAATRETTATGRRRQPVGTNPPANVRRRIFTAGAIAGLAIAVAGVVVLSPVTRARSHLRQLADNDLPVQAQIVALRTTLAEWQIFLEPHLDILVPGAAPDPAQLANGARLVSTQSAQETRLARGLRRVGLDRDAHDADVSMSALNKAIEQLTPIAAGQPVNPILLRTLIAAERKAYEELWHVTTRISAHVSQGITTTEVGQAADHLDRARLLFLIAAALELLLLLSASAIFGVRAGRRQRERNHDALGREYDARLQRALEMTKSEPDVYSILGTALREALPQLKIEMLIADSTRAHFRRALTNHGDFEGCGVIAPLDCPATTGGQALLFPSSGALDACPYLKNSPSGACSAACLPVSIAGRAVGVTHAVGPDGLMPTPIQIETINFTSRRGSERIAMLRAFETSETQAHTDPLTGLLNRRSLENQVSDLHREGIPYSLAYGDLDHFKVLNDTHGHEIGDQALRSFSRVLRDSVRPNDIVARYGGEEFVIVLPDCDTGVAVGVLERVREHLALALNAGRIPPFTVTFGVASTAYAADFDAVVTIADRALLDAKAAGRNRVLVADVVATPS